MNSLNKLKVILGKLKDYIGVSCKATLLAAAILVGAVGPVAAMDTTKMLTMFWSGDSWPEGTVYLTDSDGAYITDSDGAYITF